MSPFSQSLPSHLPPKNPSTSIKRWRTVFIVLSLCFAIGAIVSWGDRTLSGAPEDGGGKASLWHSLARWLEGLHSPSLVKENRLNILLLGQGGAGHEGPFLTDTILLLSVRPDSGDTVLVSIPRDLAIPVSGLGLRKVNEVNAIGEVRTAGNGAAFAADVIGKTLNLPIAAYIRMDFKGFEKIIDAVGGVEIDVDRPFNDNAFPDDAGGVKTVSFAAGKQNMNGATVLMYVRSRHGSNGEGSDFARAKRQQQVLLAVRDKLFSLSTLLKPGKIAAIVNTISSHFDTNIPLRQTDDLMQIAQRTSGKPITRRVLDSSPEGVLRDAVDAGGAYVLLPRDGKYETLAQYVHGLFASEDLRTESASIAVLNGTSETGLARAAADELEALGISVTVSGNAPSRNWHESVIFDLSQGRHPRTRAALEEKYHARTLTSSVPEEILNAAARSPLQTEGQARPIDIILILGK